MCIPSTHNYHHQFIVGTEQLPDLSMPGKDIVTDNGNRCTLVEDIRENGDFFLRWSNSTLTGCAQWVDTYSPWTRSLLVLFSCNGREIPIAHCALFMLILIVPFDWAFPFRILAIESNSTFRISFTGLIIKYPEACRRRRSSGWKDLIDRDRWARYRVEGRHCCGSLTSVCELCSAGNGAFPSIPTVGNNAQAEGVWARSLLTRGAEPVSNRMTIYWLYVSRPVVVKQKEDEHEDWETCAPCLWREWCSFGWNLLDWYLFYRWEHQNNVVIDRIFPILKQLWRKQTLFRIRLTLEQHFVMIWCL